MALSELDAAPWRRATLGQLRAFAVVYESATLTEAAKRLNISQPTLSQLMATLEKAIGVPLMVRSQSGIVLTAAGEQLGEGIQAPLAHLNENLACVALSASRQPMRVGLCAGVPEPVVSRAASKLARRGRSLVWSAVSTSQQPELLASGDLDAAVGRTRTPGAEMLAREPLGALVGRNCPLAERQNLTVEDLRDYDIAWFNEAQAPEYAARLRAWLRERDLDCGLRELPAQSAIVESILRDDGRLFALLSQQSVPGLVWLPIEAAPCDEFWLASRTGGMATHV